MIIKKCYFIFFVFFSVLALISSCKKEKEKGLASQKTLFYLDKIDKTIEINLPKNYDTTYSWKAKGQAECLLPYRYGSSLNTMKIIKDTYNGYEVEKADSINRFSIRSSGDQKCKDSETAVKSIFFEKSAKRNFCAQKKINPNEIQFYKNAPIKIDNLDFIVYYSRGIGYNQYIPVKEKGYYVGAFTKVDDWRIELEFECFEAHDCDSSFFDLAISSIKTLKIK